MNRKHLTILSSLFLSTLFLAAPHTAHAFDQSEFESYMIKLKPINDNIVKLCGLEQASAITDAYDECLSAEEDCKTYSDSECAAQDAKEMERSEAEDIIPLGGFNCSSQCILNRMKDCEYVLNNGLSKCDTKSVTNTTKTAKDMPSLESELGQIQITPKDPDKDCGNDKTAFQVYIESTPTKPKTGSWTKDGSSPFLTARPGDVVTIPSASKWSGYIAGGKYAIGLYGRTKIEVPCDPPKEKWYSLGNLFRGVSTFLIPKAEGGHDYRYEAVTNTVITGVRGTQFAIDAGESEDKIFVFDGAVELISKADPDLPPVSISSGQWAKSTKDKISDPSTMSAKSFVSTYPDVFPDKTPADFSEGESISSLTLKFPSGSDASFPALSSLNLIIGNILRNKPILFLLAGIILTLALATTVLLVIRNKRRR